MSGVIRVAIVDDHPLYREGVAAVLKAASGFDIVGQGGTAEDAARLVRERCPDVLLLDVILPGDGVFAARKLMQAFPKLRIAMLTMSEDQHHVSVSMNAGASGYILKGISGPDLAQVLRDIHSGARYVTPSLAGRLIARDGTPAAVVKLPLCLANLTPRETEIMQHVIRGMTNKEVAHALSLSEKTVKHYMTVVMQKLQARNRMEVVLIVSGKLSVSDSEFGSGQRKAASTK